MITSHYFFRVISFHPVAIQVEGVAVGVCTLRLITTDCCFTLAEI